MVGLVLLANRETFQSTRGPEGPRDGGHHQSMAFLRGFNPRAAPKDRATQAIRRWSVALTVSIHARPRRTARPQRNLDGRPRELVSIHARPRRTARPAQNAAIVAEALFQSTRGPEGPRDRARRLDALATRVSIHARPRRTARRAHRPRDGGHGGVSIHARPRRTARPVILPGHAVAGQVSIHARPRRTARPSVPAVVPVSACFNPRAAPKDRATRARELALEIRRFQSTRGPEGPRDV